MEQKKITINMEKQEAPQPKAKPMKQYMPVALVLVVAALSIWGVIGANLGKEADDTAQAVSGAPMLLEPETDPAPEEEVLAVALAETAVPKHYAQARIPSACFLDEKLAEYEQSEEAYEKKLAAPKVYTIEEMLEFAAALTKPGTGASNIAAYQQKSSDVRGWLRIPGTNIDYPVLQGPDTLFYEYRDINKNYSKMGVIWADSASVMGSASELSSNTILYGHNWTNYRAPLNVARAGDTMFAQVPSYHYSWFYQRFPYIYFSTDKQEMTWQVFAAFYTDLSFIYNYANPDTATYSNILSTALSKRLYNTGVSVSASDKILTLSTCTRILGNHENQRFVVMAKLIQ